MAQRRKVQPGYKNQTVGLLGACLAQTEKEHLFSLLKKMVNSFHLMSRQKTDSQIQLRAFGTDFHYQQRSVLFCK